MDEDKKTPQVQKWLETIAEYDREFKKWESRVTKIVKRYRDERTTGNESSARFNILWSNIQTLIPSCYAKTPDPEVVRRFSDQDDIGRVASIILERALLFEMHHYGDFGETMRNCVEDRFLGGRGTAWVRYDPDIESQELEVTDDAEEQEEDEFTESPQERLLDEKTPVDYVHWRDFGHNVCRTWQEVTCVWRAVYMDRAALVKRFGDEIGGAIPLDSAPEDLLKNTMKSNIGKKALVYEIWDRTKEQAVWISKSYKDVLDEKEDPLKLEGFFPCPKPLYSTTTNDSLVPIPDFALYQDQAKELDSISDRIDGLIKALKVRGVYDASVPALQRLMTEGDNNTLIPVENWGGLSEKGGLKGAFELVPLDTVASALVSLYDAQKNVKDQIMDITGLADIVRGVGQAGETATAQGIKGNFVGLRLNCSQGQVAQFASDIIRIKAQIISTYSPEILLQISSADQLNDHDKQLIPQALQMIQNKVLRTFRIEVDADSLVKIDEAQEKADRVEFIGAFSSLIKEATPLLAQAPETGPLVLEIMKYGIGAYKGAKSLEGMIDSQLDQLNQAAQQKAANPPPPKPDPEMAKVQAQSQLAQQQSQMDMQMEQQKAQIQMQLEAHKQQMQHQQILAQNQIEAQRAAQEAQNDAALQQQKVQHDATLANMQAQSDKYKTDLEAAVRIITAQIAAKSALDVQGAQAETKSAQVINKDLSNG
jgi:hypothetical protein